MSIQIAERDEAVHDAYEAGVRAGQRMIQGAAQERNNEAQQREEAHRRADDYVSGALERIRAQIHACNYGLAADAIGDLLGVLPHDNNGQGGVRPLLNIKLAEVKGIEPDPYDVMKMEGIDV